ncbi:uncharacterized protein LOC128214165 [Mya arenaria]|uniref:uncharacterized protein LOC128214165 n=1 Tax=Mya arenaria TaxID=6604 RepID=UPI0022E6C1E4|nr:uncharacterized protein LOC128214165 [Mya arenaria]
MGVVAETDVDYGAIYGPFPAVGNIPSAHFIGYLTSDSVRETASVRVDVHDSQLGTAWLPYVRAARSMDEQNMEAYTKDGHIYYRTLQIIRSGKELLVWYSKDFAQILGIHVSLTPIDGDEIPCPKCGESFQYQYSMLAHARFRCNGSQSTSSISPGRRHPKTDHALPSPSFSDGHASDNSDNSDIRILKRKSDSDVDLDLSPAKVMVVEENNNVATPPQCSPKAERERGEAGSAFRKVEKSTVSHSPTGQSNEARTSVHRQESRSIANEMLQEKSQDNLMRHLYNKRMMPSAALNNRFVGGFGMMMPNWLVPKSSSTQQYIDPRLYAERCPVPTSSKPNFFQNLPGPINVLSQDAIRSYPNGEMLSKQILMEQLRKSQLPCVPTANPMVEKILQTASTPPILQRPIQQMNLAQNWCAKCNATFRMTSDLVYHMRSHHKREFDPIKRKRDDKLQCDVCKETFKERHHLTRHMTSHS